MIVFSSNWREQWTSQCSTSVKVTIFWISFKIASGIGARRSFLFISITNFFSWNRIKKRIQQNSIFICKFIIKMKNFPSNWREFWLTSANDASYAWSSSFNAVLVKDKYHLSFKKILNITKFEIYLYIQKQNVKKYKWVFKKQGERFDFRGLLILT